MITWQADFEFAESGLTEGNMARISIAVKAFRQKFNIPEGQEARITLTDAHHATVEIDSPE